MKRMKAKQVGPCLALVAMLVAGCGSDDSGGVTPPAPVREQPEGEIDVRIDLDGDGGVRYKQKVDDDEVDVRVE
jgi:hypothetical protein